MMDHNFKFDEFVLPVKIFRDCDYLESLRGQFNKYQSRIESMSLPEEVAKVIKGNCDNIIEAVEHYYRAEVGKAQEKIKCVLEKYKQNEEPYIIAPISDNYAFKACSPPKLHPIEYRNDEEEVKRYEDMYQTKPAFYRGRTSDIPLTRLEMLHIPFDMRRKISTQRFSIAGIPCFYFATTSLGAWIELGKPEPDKFYISQYEVPEDLKILNLCIHTDLINGILIDRREQEEIIQWKKFLEIFPLVIATSYVVKTDDFKPPFKSEYIISQLVMQATSDLGLDGVAYLSKKIMDKYAYPQAVNLAILIKQAGEKDGKCRSNIKYWSRINEVKLTKPITLKECLINKKYREVEECNKKSTFVNKFFGYQEDKFPEPDKLVEWNDAEIYYNNTCFSKVDEVLADRERQTAEELLPDKLQP